MSQARTHLPLRKEVVCLWVRILQNMISGQATRNEIVVSKSTQNSWCHKMLLWLRPRTHKKVNEDLSFLNLLVLFLGQANVKIQYPKPSIAESLQVQQIPLPSLHHVDIDYSDYSDYTRTTQGLHKDSLEQPGTTLAPRPGLLLVFCGHEP